MADKKITQLTAASAVGSSDLTVLVQGSATFKATIAQIATRIAAELSANGIAGSLSIAGGALSPASTFTRDSVAYWNGTPYAINEPRFVDPSQSGIVGLMNEEARTNILSANQSKGLSGWTVGGSAEMTWTQGASGEEKIVGVVNTTLTGESYIQVAINGSTYAGQPQTFSFEVEVTGRTAGDCQMRVFDFQSGGGADTSYVLPSGNIAGRYSVTRTLRNPIDNTASSILYRFRLLAGVNAGTTVTIRRLHVYAKAYDLTWQPGGTPASAETTTVPTNGLLAPSAGSVTTEVYISRLTGTPSRYLFRVPDSGATDELYVGIVNNKWQAKAGSAAAVASAATVTTGAHYAVLVWSGATWDVYVDGVLVLSGTGNTPFAAFGATGYIGSDGTAKHINDGIRRQFYHTRRLSAAEAVAASLGNVAPDFTAYLDFTQGTLTPDELAVDGRITAEHGLVVKSGVVSLPAASISELALPASAQLNSEPYDLPSYTKTTLPAHRAGRQVYVTDVTGGAEVCFSDGVSWRRNSDRTVVS